MVNEFSQFARFPAANPLPNVKPFGAAPLGADGKPMKEVPMDEAQDDYSAYDDTLAQILKHAGVDHKVTPAPDYETGVTENRGKWDTVGRPENLGLHPYEVMNRFPHEVKKFRQTGMVDDDLYHALYDWYLEKGEIPDEIMKDRDRDGREWIAMQLGHECDLEESGMYEGDVGVTPTPENREFDLDRLRKLALGK